MRLIVGAAVATIVAGTVIGTGWVTERGTRRALTQELHTRLLMQARNLALLSTDALLSPFPELTLVPLVKDMQAKGAGLAFVVVQDHRGDIRGHIDPRQLGASFQLPSSLRPVATQLALARGEAILADAQTVVAAVPAVRADQQQVGTAVVGLDRGYLDGALKRLRRQLTMVFAAVLLAGTILAVLITSVLLRPIKVLRRGLERIGSGDLDTPVKLGTRTELGLLALAINDMTTRLRAAQSELVEKERLAHEMELARQMQQSLLPARTVEVDGFAIECSCTAASEVGGDFYDVASLPDGRISVAIADVAGKGLSGCLVTSMLAVLLRTLRPLHTSPAQLLVEVEKHLSESLQRGVFVTVFYAVIDPTSGHMVYASAGHSPLLVYRASRKELHWLPTRGIPLCVGRGGTLAKSLDDATLGLGVGDLLVQYTDGLNEATKPTTGEEFGLERIGAVVLASAGQGVAGVRSALSATVKQWCEGSPMADDLTLQVIGRVASPRAAKPNPAPPIASIPGSATSRDELRRLLRESDHLVLRTHMDDLQQLQPWLATSRDLRHLSRDDQELVHQVLYEVCANIVEHGCAYDACKEIDIWWLSPGTRALLSLPGEPASEVDAAARGYLLILDEGRSYDAGMAKPLDLSDPAVRRRGRGLGLPLVHAAMSRVIYLPSTPAGNVLLLRFDPARCLTEGDVQGAGAK